MKLQIFIYLQILLAFLSNDTILPKVCAHWTHILEHPSFTPTLEMSCMETVMQQHINCVLCLATVWMYYIWV